MKQDVVVVDMRSDPLGVFPLLRLFLLSEEFRERFKRVWAGAGYNYDNWRDIQRGGRERGTKGEREGGRERVNVGTVQDHRAYIMSCIYVYIGVRNIGGL